LLNQQFRHRLNIRRLGRLFQQNLKRLAIRPHAEAIGILFSHA